MILYTGRVVELPYRPGDRRKHSWTDIAIRAMGNVFFPTNFTGEPDKNNARSARAILTYTPERENLKNARIDLFNIEGYEKNME